MFLKNHQKNARISKETLRLFKSNQGICFLHNHEDVAFWEHLAALILALPKEVKHIYLEYTDTREIDDKLPLNRTTPFLLGLMDFIQTDESSGTNSQVLQTQMIHKLLESIVQTDITIFFVDHTERNNKSVTERNDYMYCCINQLNKNLLEDEKFIVITGFGHFDLAASLNAASIAMGSMFKASENSKKVDCIKIKHNTNVSSVVGSYDVDTLIKLPLSPFQSKDADEDSFIFPNKWNLSIETLNKIYEIQKATHAGISVSIGKPFNLDEHIYKDKPPTINLKIHRNKIKTETFKEVIKYLSNTPENKKGFSFWNTTESKKAKIKSRKNEIEFVFKSNESFINAINQLHSLISENKEQIASSSHP